MSKLGRLNLDLVPETRKSDEEQYWEDVALAWQIAADGFEYSGNEFVEDFLGTIESRIKNRYKLTEKQYMKLMELKLQCL